VPPRWAIKRITSLIVGIFLGTDFLFRMKVALTASSVSFTDCQMTVNAIFVAGGLAHSRLVECSHGGEPT
jgi:hypothetical protein